MIGRDHRKEAKPMGQLDGKVAIVTGSGRGIGQQVALRLARDGAAVVVNDLDDAPAKETIALIEKAGGRAVACNGDVTAKDFGERIVSTAVERLGGLHVIVNNAGYTWDNVIQKMTDEQWYAMLDCHLTAPFRILRAAQPVIRAQVKAEQEAGRRVVRKVVNVSSVAGLFGNAGQANYSAAKAGIVGMTMTLAKEWGRLNVAVNCVAYGLIKTRLTVAADGEATASIDGRDIKVGVNPDLMAMMERSIPLGRGGTPEEAAGAVYALCIPETDYVSGQTLMCTGGLTGI
jgi:3-oxoacyl-[acyl-carrier protein] reductase